MRLDLLIYFTLLSFAISATTPKPTANPTVKPPTANPTQKPTFNPSVEPSQNPTCVPTFVPSALPTKPTPVPSANPTPIPTSKPSTIPTPIPSAKPTTPSSQPTSQPTRQPTTQPTSRPTHPTGQPSGQPTSAPFTSRPSGQPTRQPTSQPTSQPLSRPTSQPTRQPTSQPSLQPFSRPSSTPTRQPSSQPSRQPFSFPTSQPSNMPSSNPTSPSSVPSTSPTNPTSQPTSQPTFRPSGQPSRQPSAQPFSRPSSRPTSQPISHPSGQPTSQPSRQPTGQPNSYPSSQPTRQPAAHPTTQPTSNPTQPTTCPTSRPSSSHPSGFPSTIPTGQPTRIPTNHPTGQPSILPSSQPTKQPFSYPSSRPTSQPVSFPTTQPSSYPSNQPSSQPTNPTTQPSSQPSGQPSERPSSQPTNMPSTQPSGQPSNHPTSQPSMQPTTHPSMQPSCQPSSQPSLQPFSYPSSQPTKQPTSRPSMQPTNCPSSQPSMQPTSHPSMQPTCQPSSQPTNPTSQPSARPSMQPTSLPSMQPSRQPTSQPSGQPTRMPSAQPSRQPTSHPSAQPTRQPSSQPSRQPTDQPSSQPTRMPTSQPSGQPSRQPSSQPSRQPTSQPSSLPSCQPTSQPTNPTSQPTSQPSKQPTNHPSAQPSRQPTSQPSGQPTTQPSSQPSKQPFSRPTSRPTQQPTSQPSRQPFSRPSSQPTRIPSSQPSSQPSRQPSAQPTRQPFSRPSSQPTKSPSAQPSRQPTSQPSAQPTRLPSAQPSRQPTRRPSSQPSRRPSSQPSSQPTHHPTSQPSRQPTAQPNSHPSHRPSGQPTSQPSWSPTSQPSGIPTFRPISHPLSEPTSIPTTSHPTSQPSSHPTKQPFSRPSSEPTDQPSSSPSLQPFSVPTSLPTTQPSSEPSSFPSSQPSSHPSSQPNSEPSSFPSSQPSSHPSSQPSSKPSISPLSRPTSQPTSTPSSRPSSVPTSHPSGSPSGQPSSSPTSQPTISPSARPTSLPTTHPSSIPSIIPTSSPTTPLPTQQPTPIPTALPSYNPTFVPTVVPTQLPSQIPTVVPTFSPSSLPTVSPTFCPSTLPTPYPTSLPSLPWVASNLIQFINFTSVQILPPVTPAISRTTIGVQFTVQQVALNQTTSVGCQAFPTGSLPQSSGEILNSGSLVTLSKGFTGAMYLDGLVPSTQYLVVCVSSFRGRFMPLSVAMQFSVPSTTACCKSTSFSISNSFLNAGLSSPVSNVLSISWDYPPSSSLQIDFSFRDANSSSTLRFYPSTLSLSPSSAIGGSSLFSILDTRVSPGHYLPQFTLSGPSASEYSLSPSNQYFTLLTYDQPLPVVSALSAAFSSGGESVILTFDSCTDQATLPLSSSFPCSTILSFANAASSTCSWSTCMSISILTSDTGSSTQLLPGSTIWIKAGLLRPARSPKTSFNLQESVVVALPLKPLTPSVVLSVPVSVGKCDSILLDLGASSGAGGRPWSSISYLQAFEVDPITESLSSAPQLQSFLNTQFSPSIPLIINNDLLRGGKTYSFSATLCTFLGYCSQMTSQCSVQVGNGPSVVIPGPNSRTMTRNSPLLLTSLASISACSNITSSSFLNSFSYTWFVTNMDGVSLPLSSESRDPSIFKASPNTFSLNSQQLVSLRVTSLSSGLSSVATVTVRIVPSSLVSLISGGSNRVVRLTDSISLSGALSSDPDDPSASLRYLWTGVQTSPSFNLTCESLFSSSVANHQQLTLFASFSSEAVVCQVTLTVMDPPSAKTTRSSQSQVQVTVVGTRAPLLTVTPSLTGSTASMGSFGGLPMINSGQGLTLSGAVSIFPGDRALVTWKETTGHLDLSAVALSRTNQTITSSINIFQSIPPNSFLPGVSYAFSLICTLSPTLSTSVSVSIYVNSNPTTGRFTVTPSTGFALTDSFQFVASQWQDPEKNYPLTYQFGFQDSVGAELTLQSRSEVSYLSSKLSPGMDINGYALKCQAKIFDSIGASTIITTSVVVLPSTPQMTIDFLNINLNVSQGVSVDTIKKSNSLASAILNNVNCLSAPNCSSLNRLPCSTVPNTCGNCLSDKYIGTTGGFNTLCVPFAGTLGNASSISICRVNFDCGLNKVCSDGICSFPPQECNQNCSGHGACHYRDVSTNLQVSSCKINDLTCSPRCRCSSGYFGSTCSMTQSEFNEKSAARSLVAQNLQTIIYTEDPTPESIVGWVSSLRSLTQIPDQIPASLVSNCLDMASNVVSMTGSVGLSYETVLPILETIDSLNNIQIEPATTVLHSPSSSPVLNSDPSSSNLPTASPTKKPVPQSQKIENLLSSYSQLISQNLVVGQPSVEVVKSSFRLSCVMLNEDDLKLSEMNNSTSSSPPQISLSSPLTEFEIQSGVKPQSVSFDLSESEALLGRPVSVISMSSFVYENPGYASNPLKIVLPDSSISRLNLVLQNNVPVRTMIFENTLSTNISNLNGTIHTPCGMGDYSVHNYTCTYLGTDITEIIFMSCNGTEGIITATCPILSQSPSCNSAQGSFEADAGCNVSSSSDQSVSCTCPVSSSNSSSGRRVLFSQPSQTFVSMASVVGSNFVNTWVSAGSLTAADVARSWIVLAVVAGFASILIVFGLIGYFLDEQDKLLRDKANEDEHSRNELIKSRPSLFMTFLRSSLISPQTKKTISIPDKKNEPTPMDEVLPSIFHEKPFTQKLVNELKTYHRWVGVVYRYSPYMPRILRVLSLGTNATSVMFLQAVFYNLKSSNKQVCPTLATHDQCLALRSRFDSSSSVCYWNPHNDSCIYNSTSQSYTVLAFIFVLASLFSVPMSLFSDMLINILVSPTKSSISAAASNMQKSLSRNQRENRIDFQNRVFGSVVETEFQELSRELRAYRGALTTTERIEFDEMWGLDSEGNFLKAETKNSSVLPCFAKKGLNVEGAVMIDLKHTRNKFVKESLPFSSLNSKAKQKKLLYLFQKDLLPGMSGEALEFKSNRENEQPSAVTPTTKTIAIVILTGYNIGMLFYVYLFAMSEDKYSQHAWMKGLLTWALNEIVFASTLVALVTHVIVPYFTMADMTKVKNKLRGVLQNYHAKQGSTAGSKYEQKEEEEQGEGNSQLIDLKSQSNLNPEFNAAKYLFISYRLALKHPNLHTSKVILSFTNQWPHRSYKHVVDVTRSYNTRSSVIMRSAMPMLIMMLSTAIDLPAFAQDFVIKETATVFMSYFFYYIIYLYHLNPFLAVLPFLILGAVIHFFIGSSFAAKSAKEKLAQVRSVQPQETSSLSSPDPLVEDTQLVPAGALKTRRQSLAQGLELSRRLSVQLDQKLTRNKKTLYSDLLQPLEDDDEDSSDQGSEDEEEDENDHSERDSDDLLKPRMTYQLAQRQIESLAIDTELHSEKSEPVQPQTLLQKEMSAFFSTIGKRKVVEPRPAPVDSNLFWNLGVEQKHSDDWEEDQVVTFPVHSHSGSQSGSTRYQTFSDAEIYNQNLFISPEPFQSPRFQFNPTLSSPSPSGSLIFDHLPGPVSQVQERVLNSSRSVKRAQESSSSHLIDQFMRHIEASSDNHNFELSEDEDEDEDDSSLQSTQDHTQNNLFQTLFQQEDSKSRFPFDSKQFEEEEEEEEEGDEKDEDDQDILGSISLIATPDSFAFNRAFNTENSSSDLPSNS